MSDPNQTYDSSFSEDLNDSDIALLHKRLKGRSQRRRTPTILQMEATECGAASLAMILGYYGCFIPLEELRSVCAVSRDGSKASNILKAARKYGLQASGYKKELPDLAEITFPAIVFWNFNHFLVLEGFKRGKVYINDPSTGPRVISFEEFDEAFTGVIMLFQPDEDFRKRGSLPGLWRHLSRRLSCSRDALSFIVLVSLSLVIPGLVIPVFSKVFVDQILVNQMENWFMPLLIGMSVTAILRACLTWLQQSYLARMKIKIAIVQSSSFFWHALRLPMDFFSQRFAGDIATRVAANDRVADLLSGPLVTNMANILTVGFYFAVMLSFDVVLTVIGGCLVGINVVVLRLLSRVREDASRRMLQDQGRLAGCSVAGIQLIETLKSSGQESDFFARWAGYQAKYITSQQELSSHSAILNAVPVLLSQLTTAAILGFGAFRVIEGSLSIGDLVAFQSLMTSFTSPIEGMVRLAGDLQTIKGDLTRIDDVLKYPVDQRFADIEKTDKHNHKLAKDSENDGNAISDTSPAQRLSYPQESSTIKLSGRIELNNIVFGYSRSASPLIDNLSLIVEPGQRIALIGGSGSGKSTVAKLASGLFRPWSGQILFDGIPFDEIPSNCFSNSVATVDQDIFLFQGTIRENLALWDRTIQDATITAALRDAAILDVIEARPGRHDATVDELGTNFSGGQRQRIEIARALINNPSMLILDEATAALDPLVEKAIDDNIRRRGCTCLVVAHRLSTIRDCDEIIVLDRGQIVQRGIHEEMILEDGHYAKLMRSESSHG